MTVAAISPAARADASTDWSAANQAWLMRAVAAVASHLERQAAGAGAADPGLGAAPPIEWPDDLIDSPPALETLCSAFHLSDFERDLLLLCAGMELESRFGGLCAAAQGGGANGSARAYPTFSLALSALPRPEWGALGPDAPLRRWQLLELDAARQVTLAPLRIDERVLHFLAGVQHGDERLAGLVAPVRGVVSVAEMAPSQAEVARKVAALWASVPRAAALPLIQLHGPDPDDRALVAEAACQRLGLRLLSIAAETLPSVPAEADALARLCERESVLTRSALLVECDGFDAGDPDRLRPALRFAERVTGPVILGGRNPHRGARRSSASFEVALPSVGEQRDAWRAVLAPALSPSPGAAADDAQLDRLVWTFRLGAAAIRDCATETLAHSQAREGAASLGDVAWSVCRARSRTRLEALATYIHPAACWDDLVLPAPHAQTLRQIIVHVRHRATVYERWGFAGRNAAGLGIAALFHGPSGTGKSLAAEIVAGELGLDLFRIDLSQVVSKYIGETEKNLRRVFDAAEEGGAVLVFDEADALFGKRSEVKDSHDRYANIEVGFLLQRIESYRGVAVLTTNLKSSLDTAFLRRIRFVVQFPFPDAAQRSAIWRRAFPREVPTQDLDVARLAQLDVAGGHIRNIALGAAFLAAEEKQPVRMAHLARAARAEFAKLEKPLREPDLAGWT